MRFLSFTRKAMITVAAAGTLAVAAAGVSSAETSAPAQSGQSMVQVQQGKGQAGPLGVGDCTQHLTNTGYTVTNTRFAICAAAALAGTPTAVVACTGALWATGVDAINSGVACTLAIAPSPAPRSA